MGLFQGLLNNLSEVDNDKLQTEYQKYLMEGETIELGFKLVRDALIFTNDRILTFDKQGATGKKMSVESIYLDSIYQVDCETAGFGFDDSEVTIHYQKSPYRRGYSVEVGHKKYEFPKKYDISPVYIMLQTLCKENLKRLNS